MRKNKVRKNSGVTGFNILKISLSCILIILPFTLFLLLPGCTDAGTTIEQVSKVFSQQPPSIEEMVICKNVDSSFAPVEPSDVFPKGTNSIYLSVKFSNFARQDKIKVIWTYVDTQKQLSVQEFSPPEKSSGFHSFNIKIASSFPSGSYNAEIYLNGKALKKLDFTVE